MIPKKYKRTVSKCKISTRINIFPIEQIRRRKFSNLLCKPLCGHRRPPICLNLRSNKQAKNDHPQFSNPARFIDLLSENLRFFSM